MTTRGRSSPENLLLYSFCALTVFSVFMYWLFGLHPERIPDVQWMRTFYVYSFAWFARVHIAFAGITLIAGLIAFAQKKWLTMFAWVFLLSFIAEHIGTGYGVPYSAYYYTDLLGFTILDRVPFVIPISWATAAVPSWVIARHVFKGPGRSWQKITFATWLVVVYDLALDPAMSYLTTYWVWEEPGSFYGMPWLNLFGWAATAAMLMVAMDVLERRGAVWADLVPTRWAIIYLGAVTLMPLGMVTVAGMWGSTIATLVGIVIAVVVGKRVVRADRAAPRPATPIPAEASGSISGAD